jgi:hypothetical protein
MKRYGKVEVQLHAFLTSEVETGEWSVSRPSRFTHWIEDQISPTAGLNAVKTGISCPCQKSNTDSLVVQSVVWSLSRLQFDKQVPIIVSDALLNSCPCFHVNKTANFRANVGERRL